MNKYIYSIKINVPLGIREGTMVLYEKDGNLNGLLELFENIEPFHGTVLSNGMCKIAGTIVTLTKTMNYQAIGRMCSRWIKLDVYDEKEKFYMEGVRVEYEKGL